MVYFWYIFYNNHLPLRQITISLKKYIIIEAIIFKSKIIGDHEKSVHISADMYVMYQTVEIRLR